MPVDKNLFPYDLAVTAIFKNEARYLKEWLDYHLLAGVEHFYLYNNDSIDNFAQVLAPYVAANFVTLTDFPGKVMQMPAYVDALNRFKFTCRYMAFIDVDEFIFPQTNRSIVEVVDEILSRDSNAAGVAINWQLYGSNGQETADYSRGVLERFTRRAPHDYELDLGNTLVKSIIDPRKVEYMPNPHSAIYLHNFHAVNAAGEIVAGYLNKPVNVDKIVVNHYFTKSREEYSKKFSRGRSDVNVKYSQDNFELQDRNEIFDDGILTYRANRAENFSVESDDDRLARVEKTLTEILTQRSPFDAPQEFFTDKLETFLTCRSLSEAFAVKIAERSAEEYALVWIHQCLNQAGVLNYSDLQLFMSDLPEILARPFPLCKKFLPLARERVIPTMCEALKFNFNVSRFVEYNYIRQLLSLMS